MRMLVLATDAFGGRGGIAKFNRDLLTTLCLHPDVDEVVALPRLLPEDPGVLPKGLSYKTGAAGGKATFTRSVLRELATGGEFDGVVCGHLNLLPLAALAARWKQVPLLLVIHGIDAWEAPAGGIGARLTRLALAHTDAFVAVSQVTKDRFLAWADLPEAAGFVVPNCIDASGFGPGPRTPELLERYGLADRTILLTVGRLSAQEQYKGHDEVLEVLPKLATDVPGVAYLIVGDGDDRARLEQKAEALGVADRVVFAGYIPEADKADHYRLADAFVMPGRGEGFGIVYLEALACGVPVVASLLDASREAVRDGMLGHVVDPGDASSVRTGILAALASEREVPDGLAYFSFERFVDRWHGVVDRVFGEGRGGVVPHEHSVVPTERQASSLLATPPEVG